MPSLQFFLRRHIALILVLGALGAPLAPAQSDVNRVKSILGEEILSPAVALFQVKQYLVRHTVPPPAPTSAEQWTVESARLRSRLLEEVVYHGWTRQWVDAPARFEDRGVIETGQGYRIRKLRYEIVPGFYSAALLYEPDQISSRVPAIVNVNGHVGAPGKAVEYKQKRCINFARRGILALNLEWLSFGELNSPENRHWFGAHLDLVGTHHLGLFYLLMRKGIDYLAERPDVDPKRIGVTGLSGGGWQTIVLSALDERVAVSVPVAGFASNRSRVEAREHGDLGDLEQSATDLLTEIDYPHLVALRAPRPTLLAYNAEDDCCFRAPIARPYIYDAIRPIYALFGKQEAIAWHENLDPGTHNYQRDNRIAAYRFFARHFGLPPVDTEIAVDGEIKSYDELVVGLPADNLTILGLARKLAKEISRPVIPNDGQAKADWISSMRERLRTLLRYMPVGVGRSWLVANTKSKELETLSYLFETVDGISSSAVLLKSMHVAPSAPVTIILSDGGKSAIAAAASDRVNRGEQVLAADLPFFGDAWKKQGLESYIQILHGMGRRALGLQAAHLAALTRWIRDRAGAGKVRLETEGMRSQAAALAAAALEPTLYSEIQVRSGLRSWLELLEKPVTFSEAPELFCLNLYKEFDVDRLALLASPVLIKAEPAAKASPR